MSSTTYVAMESVKNIDYQNYASSQFKQAQDMVMLRNMVQSTQQRVSDVQSKVNKIIECAQNAADADGFLTALKAAFP